MGVNEPEDRAPTSLLGRIVGLRCPRCGVGRMFRGLLRMEPKCSECGLVYERDGGYFLGSSYVNYGFTALSLTVAYISLHFGAGWSNTVLAGPLVAWVILFPLFFFRYARAIWLGMDFYFDATGFEEDVPRDTESSDQS